MNMRLFSDTIYEPILPEDDISTEDLDIDNSTGDDVSSESIENSPAFIGNTPEKSDKPYWIVKEYDEQGSLHASIYMLEHIHNTKEIVMLLAETTESDTIDIYISDVRFSIDSIFAILSAISASPAYFRTYGYTIRNVFGVCVWALGTERNTTIFSHFEINNYTDIIWGSTTKLQEGVDETRRITKLLHNILLKINLVTQDELNLIEEAKKPLALYGENLQSRVNRKE